TAAGGRFASWGCPCQARRAGGVNPRWSDRGVDTPRSPGGLMVEDELGAVEERPEDVGKGLVLVPGGAAGLDVAEEPRGLVRPRLARQGGEVEGFDAAGAVQERGVEDRRQDFAARRVRQVADQAAVHEGQRLGDRRLLLRPLLLGVE